MARDYMSVLEDKVLELEYQLEQRDKAFEESIKVKKPRILIGSVDCSTDEQ